MVKKTVMMVEMKRYPANILVMMVQRFHHLRGATPDWTATMGVTRPTVIGVSKRVNRIEFMFT